jgi:hypothetical protein
MQIPEESLVHIFGFLDLKSLGTVASVCKCFELIQKEESIWISLLPPLKLFKSDPLELKKSAQLFLIPLGSRKAQNRCVLDLKHKTITLLKPSDNVSSSCLLAAQRSEFSHRSFIAYIGSQHVPNAVIKNERGMIEVLVDVPQPNDGPTNRDNTTRQPISQQWFQKETTGFQEYKLISDQEPEGKLHM